MRGRVTVKLGLLRSFAAAGAMVVAMAGAPEDASAAPQAPDNKSQSAQQDSPNKLDIKDRALFLRFGKASNGLQGYADYCNRPEGDKLPADCDARSDNMEVVIMDDFTRDEIFKVNLFVNAAINPQSDLKKYGMEEHWAVPKFIEGKGLEGDCEDYVLLKIHELKQAGVPLSSMSIMHVKTETGEGHAVLAVRTNKGDLILDNLNNELRTPAQVQAAGYELIQAVSLTNKTQWQKLVPPPPKPDPIRDLLKTL